MFLVHLNEGPQSAFSIFNLQKAHSDEGIANIQQFIEENHNKKIMVDELANRYNTSSRTFIRHFTEATGNSPKEYIQRVRVEAAKRMLETTDDKVEQICLKSGYEDFNYFRKVFKRYTGISPQAYRKKYRLKEVPEAA